MIRKEQEFKQEGGKKFIQYKENMEELNQQNEKLRKEEQRSEEKFIKFSLYGYTNFIFENKILNNGDQFLSNCNMTVERINCTSDYFGIRCTFENASFMKIRSANKQTFSIKIEKTTEFANIMLGFCVKSPVYDLEAASSDSGYHNTKFIFWLILFPIIPLKIYQNNWPETSCLK